MGTQSHITRRHVLKSGGALVAAVAALLSRPPQTYGSGVEFQMPPVHTVFLTAALNGTPTKKGQSAVSRAVEVIEEFYPWGAASLLTFVAYGLPYFSRLPGGLTG